MAPYTFWHFPYSFSYFRVTISSSSSSSAPSPSASTHSFRQWMARHLTSSHSFTTATSPPSIVWRDPADVHAFIETTAVPTEYHAFAQSQDLAILTLQTSPPIIHSAALPPSTALTSSASYSATSSSSVSSSASSTTTNAHSGASAFPSPGHQVSATASSPYDMPIFTGASPMLRSSSSPSTFASSPANYHLQVLAKLFPLLTSFYPSPLFFPVSADSALFAAMAAATNSLPERFGPPAAVSSFNIFDWQAGYVFVLPAVHLTRFANAIVPSFIIKQIKPFPAPLVGSHPILPAAAPAPSAVSVAASVIVNASSSALPTASPSLSGVHTYSTLGGVDFVSPASASAAAASKTELLNTDGSIASTSSGSGASSAFAAANAAHSYAVLTSDVLKPMEFPAVSTSHFPTATQAGQATRGYSRLDEAAFAGSTKAGYSLIAEDAFASSPLSLLPSHSRGDSSVLPPSRPALTATKSATSYTAATKPKATASYAALSQDDISKPILAATVGSAALLEALTPNSARSAAASTPANAAAAAASNGVGGAADAGGALKSYATLRNADFAHLPTSVAASINVSSTPLMHPHTPPSASAATAALASTAVAAASNRNLADIPADLQLEKRASFLSITRAEAENLLKGHPFHCFLFRPTSESSSSYYVSPGVAAEPESSSSSASSGTAAATAAGVSGRKSGSMVMVDVTHFVLSYVSSAEKISHLKVYRFGPLGLSQRNDPAHAKYGSVDAFIKAVLGPKAKALCSD